jgi:hypothetical protein
VQFREWIAPIYTCTVLPACTVLQLDFCASLLRMHFNGHLNGTASLDMRSEHMAKKKSAADLNLTDR